MIEIGYSRCPVEKEIDTPVISILLESQRIQDEQNYKGIQKREHERFECLVAIDYDIDDWAYRSNIKNISISGAFIEVNHPVTIGKKIVLTFSTGTPPKSCNILGTIMRRVGKGIGIMFDDLSNTQREMVEMVIKNKEKQ